MASDSLKRLRGDSEGAAFLEFTLFAGVFFSLLFGIVEFTLAFYQWNAATKAVQLGSRLAAVSDPMAPSLTTLTGMEDGALPGDFDVPHYEYVCQGTSPTTGECNGNDGDYDSLVMDTLIYGRGNSGPNCDQSPNIGPNFGMCHMFWRIEPENVVVTYSYTGMGYAGRPGGPVPTIRIQLVDTPFQFFFIPALLGWTGDIDIPAISTMTAEDLSLSGT